MNLSSSGSFFSMSSVNSPAVTSLISGCDQVWLPSRCPPLRQMSKTAWVSGVLVGLAVDEAVDLRDVVRVERADDVGGNLRARDAGRQVVVGGQVVEGDGKLLCGSRTAEECNKKEPQACGQSWKHSTHKWGFGICWWCPIDRSTGPCSVR